MSSESAVKVLLAALGCTVALLAGCSAPASISGACVPDELAYVGADGQPMQALRVDTCTGKLSALGPVAQVPKSRWILPHPMLDIVYVAVDAGPDEGSVAAYAVQRETGALTRLNAVPAGGTGTTHLWLDRPSMTLLASNFSSGTVTSIPVRADGRLGAPVSTMKDVGSGPHRRQASAHAHSATVDPSGRYALVADLGADRVFAYEFHRTKQALSGDAAPDRAFVTPAGSGPRRAVFGPSGRSVYVLSELTAELLSLRWDPAQARLSGARVQPVSSAQFQGSRSASEMALGPDGRFLYVADRGENQLVVYRIDPVSGELGMVQRVASGGDGLWNFDIHPSGRWLLAAHYRSNSVNLLRIDPATGQLTPTGQALDTPAPVSVAFIR